MSLWGTIIKRTIWLIFLIDLFFLVVALIISLFFWWGVLCAWLTRHDKGKLILPLRNLLVLLELVCWCARTKNVSNASKKKKPKTIWRGGFIQKWNKIANCGASYFRTFMYFTRCIEQFLCNEEIFIID